MSTTEQIERILEEGAIRLSEAAKLLPPCRGKRRSTSTLTRWIEQGKAGIKLEAFTGPDKTWWTSKTALARFLAALTANRGCRQVQSQTEYQRRAEAAGEALKLARKRKG